MWGPKWRDNNLARITEQEKIWLQRPFREEEVEATVKPFDGDKAPGPDSFNMLFFKRCWHVLKEIL